MKWKCPDCGYETKAPVHGVDVHLERMCLWCAKCAPIIFVNGEPRLCEFPAKGKMIPDTILHDEPQPRDASAMEGSNGLPES